jgi:hypothetical protein
MDNVTMFFLMYKYYTYLRVRIRVMVFNVTFNNIPVISWQSENNNQDIWRCILILSRMKLRMQRCESWIDNIILDVCSCHQNHNIFAPKTSNNLDFQPFDFKCTWWRLFQKRVVHTKFDIYSFLYIYIYNID